MFGFIYFHLFFICTKFNSLFYICILNILQVFEKLREDGKSDCFNKLFAISGDVGDENLGLSSEDRLTLVEHVNIIFHSAATLDFEGTLKAAIETNLLGTRRVVQLSQEIRNLKVINICIIKTT